MIFSSNLYFCKVNSPKDLCCCMLLFSANIIKIKGNPFGWAFCTFFIYCPRLAGEERFEPEKTII